MVVILLCQSQDCRTGTMPMRAVPRRSGTSDPVDLTW
jgi:hypothetical protein